jgi:hypothetical protein
MWPNYDDELRAFAVDKIAEAGLKWVRIDISWARAETAKGVYRTSYVHLLDHCVWLALSRGLRPFVVVLGTPGWANANAGGGAPPTDPNDFRDFMQWAAERYRGSVPAWQLYNEPNSRGFWTGTLANYVAALKAGYEGVKRGDPSATVVSGGIVFNDYAWVRELYAHGAKDHFDALGVHPYQSKADEPPEYARESDSRWWFANLPRVREVMVENGDADAEIWITEFSYSAHTNEAVPPGNDFAWALGVTEQQQAEYGVRALDYARANWPYVGLFVWYKEISWPLGSLSPGWFDVHTQSYGLLRADQSERPAYRALKSYLTGR